METQEEKKVEETRETIEIITPIKKHKVVLKSYVTEKELKKIKRVWQDYEITMEMEAGAGKNEKGKVTQKSKVFNLADKLDMAEEIALKMLVVSVDDKTENIVEILNRMRPKDFAYVKKEIDKITEEDDFLDQDENTKTG